MLSHQLCSKIISRSVSLCSRVMQSSLGDLGANSSKAGGSGESIRDAGAGNGKAGVSGESILNADYDLLVKENTSLLDKYKRALAETENIRKRSAKQIEESKVYAIQNFCKDLLEVADVLNLALKSIDEKAKKDPSLKTVYEGIDMTKGVLLKVFGRHGLVSTSPLGHKFDPNIHEAVMEISKNQANCKPGYIADVVNIGYSLHDRPIRPPKVVVARE